MLAWLIGHDASGRVRPGWNSFVCIAHKTIVLTGGAPGIGKEILQKLLTFKGGVSWLPTCSLIR